MNKTIKTAETREVKERIELNYEDILEYLSFKGVIESAPQSMEVFVDIPGGADWSNTELRIQDSPVVIEITNFDEKTNTTGE